MPDISIVPEIVYFAAYVAISDNRLYDREWFRLEKYIEKNRLGQGVRDAVMDIIKDSENKISLEQVLSKLSELSADVRRRAMLLGYKVALEDGELGPREETLFNGFRVRLGIDRKTNEAVLTEARDAVLKLENAAAGENPLEERYAGTLFSAGSYSRLIERIANSAGADISFVGERIERSVKLFGEYPELFKREIDRVLKYENRLGNGEEKKQLRDFFEQLTGKLSDAIVSEEETLSLLRDKQSAGARSVTISFMGRTKAGKSTLHSVLLGGINNDFIGRGSERTTRYNYVYDFHSLRIIDTPGIGAPGGKADVDVAKEVMDESDLICYVVTSDSVQETEFNFLRELKQRNKPVIILLNKKENFLRSEKKRQAFLENPLGWFESEGEDSIKGHIDRINTYVSINHDYKNYRIVPVHLLAAKTALSERDEKLSAKYMEGSRIDEFLRILGEMVEKYGLLLKAQTIFNGASYHIKEDVKLAQEQLSSVRTLKDEIGKNCKRGFDKIESYGARMRNELIDGFNGLWESFAAEDVRRFANENYGKRKKDVKSKWNDFLKSSGIEEKLKVGYEKVWEQYKSRVEEVLADTLEDINFSAYFGELSRVNPGAVFDIKTLLGSVGAAAGVVGLFFVATPVGWVLLGVSAVMEIAGVFVKSKQKQVEESRLKLYDSLLLDLEEMRRKNLEKMLNEFDGSSKKILGKVKEYYGTIVRSLERVDVKLTELKEAQEGFLEELDKAYAMRIEGYMTGSAEYDLERKDTFDRISVERDFGKSMVINDPGLYIQPVRVSAEEISGILQEEIIIKTGV